MIFVVEGTFEAEDLEAAIELLQLTFADLANIGPGAAVPENWNVVVTAQS